MMTTEPVHVSGTDKGDNMLYALSTCIHCKHVKELLSSLNVAYDYLYVDQLPRDEMTHVLKKIEKFNPRCSFPTLILNGTSCIIGDREDEIREAVA
jgi:glutaredoxin-like protein NrdH